MQNDVGAVTTMRLQMWARPPGAAAVAILSAADFSPDELTKAIAAVQLVRRTGLLIDYASITTPTPLTSAAASTSARD